MEILVKRVAKRPSYTIGKLYINNQYFCDTCEDVDRGLTQSTPLDQIKKKKVASQTAIPTGKYDITMNVVSPRFSQKFFYKANCDGGKLPRLINVPGFDGVLIHVGNTAADSAGCLLVGKNTEVGKVLNSRNTFLSLYKKMKEANQKGEKITITIQ